MMDYCLSCMRPRQGLDPCPHCGVAMAEIEYMLPCLQPGRVLHGKYLVGRSLGQGGFGITYVGLHIDLNKRVAIKEYYPQSVTRGRSQDSQVLARTDESNQRIFQKGLQEFRDEGRRIVQFAHPNIIRALDYFEENGTAYLVMDFVDGMPLEAFLVQRGQRVTQDMALQILMPVMDGLRLVHRAGFLHRDIKPDNIYITTSGQVVLLDFGAAREAIGMETRSLDIMLTPGYAPPEQYSRRSKQGPWTDIYACAATLYRCVTGECPPDALERVSLQNPCAVAPISSFPGVQVTPAFERTIMAALELDSRKRPADMKTFQEALLGHGAPAQAQHVPAHDDAPAAPWDVQEAAQPAVMPRPAPAPATPIPNTLFIPPDPSTPAPAPPQTNTPVKQPQNKLLPILLGLGLMGTLLLALVVAGGTWWYMNGMGEKADPKERAQSEAEVNPPPAPTTPTATAPVTEIPAITPPAEAPDSQDTVLLGAARMKAEDARKALTDNMRTFAADEVKQAETLFQDAVNTEKKGDTAIAVSLYGEAEAAFIAAGGVARVRIVSQAEVGERARIAKSKAEAAALNIGLDAKQYAKDEIAVADALMAQAALTSTTPTDAERLYLDAASQYATATKLGADKKQAALDAESSKEDKAREDRAKEEQAIKDQAKAEQAARDKALMGAADSARRKAESAKQAAEDRYADDKFKDVTGNADYTAGLKLMGEAKSAYNSGEYARASNSYDEAASSFAKVKVSEGWGGK